MEVKKLLEESMIKVGDFITVVEWHSHKDNSYKGDLLEVKVVEPPYLRVYRHNGPTMMITLKLGDVEVMPLSKEFIDSFQQDVES